MHHTHCVRSTQLYCSVVLKAKTSKQTYQTAPRTRALYLRFIFLQNIANDDDNDGKQCSNSFKNMLNLKVQPPPKKRRLPHTKTNGPKRSIAIARHPHLRVITAANEASGFASNRQVGLKTEK